MRGEIWDYVHHNSGECGDEDGGGRDETGFDGGVAQDECADEACCRSQMAGHTEGGFV